MMQQLDPTWNPHQKLEFFKLCIRTTLSQIGQINRRGNEKIIIK